MEMNRDYSSDISNLLNLAVRYKSAEDEREYRNLALLAEKEYRKQNMEQDLDIAKLNILANQYDNLYKTREKLRLAGLEFGINAEKLNKINDKSPDLKEIISTAGDNFESLNSGLESSISDASEDINSIGKDIAIRQSIKNQIPGLYSGILGMTKDQSLEDLYTLTPQETGSYFEKNPNALMIGDQPYKPSPEQMNIIAGDLATMGREDYGKNADVVGVPIMEGDVPKTKWMSKNELIGTTTSRETKNENLSDEDKLSAFKAATLLTRVNEYRKESAQRTANGKKPESVDSFFGKMAEGYFGSKEYFQNNLDNILNYINIYYTSAGNTQANPLPVNPTQENNPLANPKIDFSKFKRPPAK